MNLKLQKANPQHICTAKKIKLHLWRCLIKSFQNTTNGGKRIILSISIDSCRKKRGLRNSTAQLLQSYVYHVQTALLFSCKTSACSDFCFLWQTIWISSVFILKFYLSRVIGYVHGPCQNLQDVSWKKTPWNAGFSLSTQNIKKT